LFLIPNRSYDHAVNTEKTVLQMAETLESQFALVNETCSHSDDTIGVDGALIHIIEQALLTSTIFTICNHATHVVPYFSSFIDESYDKELEKMSVFSSSSVLPFS
jgi:hypothetical protein